MFRYTYEIRTFDCEVCGKHGEMYGTRGGVGDGSDRSRFCEGPADDSHPQTEMAQRTYTIEPLSLDQLGKPAVAIGHLREISGRGVIATVDLAEPVSLENRGVRG